MGLPVFQLSALPRDTRVVYPETAGEPTALLMQPQWLDALTEILQAIQGSVPGVGVAYVDLTPGDTVTPTLESVVWNGTLAIVLDRALTTIAAATYNGGVPPAGYRFTIIVIQDATGSREIAWDPSYYFSGPVEPDGTPNLLSMYHFISIGGQHFLSGSQIGL
jgi:hypothetical protein